MRVRTVSGVLLAAALAVILMGVGCGKRTVVRGPDGATATVDTSGRDKGTVTVTDPTSGSTTVIGTGQVIPSNFPSDVPKPPGAALASHASFGGALTSASFTGEGSIEERLAFYRAELPENGWAVEREFSAGTYAQVSASKGDRRVTVLVLPGEKTGEVFITMVFGTAAEDDSGPRAE